VRSRLSHQTPTISIRRFRKRASSLLGVGEKAFVEQKDQQIDVQLQEFSLQFVLALILAFQQVIQNQFHLLIVN
jgi:hypothetical protein